MGETCIIEQSVQRTRIVNQAVHNFETVLAKRMFYIIEAQLKKGFGLQFDTNHQLWLKIPTKLLGNQHFDHLNDATDQLMNCRFRFLDKKHERFNKISPFPVVNYEKRKGFVEVKLNTDALHYLADLTEGYTWYKLKAALSLNSKYSQRLYELLIEKRDFGFWNNVTVSYIKKMLEVDDSTFKRNSDFLKNAIYNAIDEINIKTDINITFTFINNQKRPIIGFNFKIKSQLNSIEAKKYKQIDDNYSALLLMSTADQVEILMEMKEKYKWSDKLYNEILSKESLINEVVRVHYKIEEGILKPANVSKYMGGVIKRLKAGI